MTHVLTSKTLFICLDICTETSTKKQETKVQQKRVIKSYFFLLLKSSCTADFLFLLTTLACSVQLLHFFRVKLSVNFINEEEGHYDMIWYSIQEQLYSFSTILWIKKAKCGILIKKKRNAHIFFRRARVTVTR